MIETKKTAIILGGSSGLGLATAHKLAHTGYNLLLLHRDRKSNLAAFDAEVEKMQANNVTVKTFNRDALKAKTLQ